jgi:hypothetical protein
VGGWWVVGGVGSSERWVVDGEWWVDGWVGGGGGSGGGGGGGGGRGGGGVDVVIVVAIDFECVKVNFSLVDSQRRIIEVS